jgi:amidase
MARSVADLGLGLDVLAGPLPELAPAWRLELPDDGGPTSLAGLRFGLTVDDPTYPVESVVQAAVRQLADQVAAAGAEVVEGPMPVPMPQAADSWSDLVLPLIGSGLPDELYDAFAGVTGVPGDPATMGLARLTARVRDRGRADQRRQLQRRAWAEAFERVDAWLAPCFAIPAFEHDHRPIPERDVAFGEGRMTALDLTAWPGAIGAMLLPAVAVPAGATPEGLPVGVQVVGPYLQDKRLLRIAALVDEAGPGFTPPPDR